MKRYTLHQFLDIDINQYCLVDNQIQMRTQIRGKMTTIFKDKLQCNRFTDDIYHRPYNIIADADSIEELLYENPELLL